jgi:hypothetical protein
VEKKMKEIVEFINSNSNWLYVKIYENPLFFFDYWTFAHIWLGFVIFAILNLVNVKNKWTNLFLILICYEVFEIVILYLSLDVFRPETIKDQFTDIIVGIIGGFLFYQYSLIYSNKNGKIKKPFSYNNLLIALFTAATLSFEWVGFYGYKYNLSFFNSEGLNYSAFLLWFLSSFFMILIFLKLNIYFNKTCSMLLLYAVYFSVLLSGESITYHVFHWREVGNHAHQPLIFDIIHGTIALHIFYLAAPFVTVALFTLFKTFLTAAVEKNQQSIKELELITESVESRNN